MNKNEFSSATHEWLEVAKLEDRKALGQYMTPASLRTYLLNQIQLFPGAKILDPAVGTGEFLRSALEREPELNAYGWDVDEEILTFARKNVELANFRCVSALSFPERNTFDFVIGNPPYFEMKLTPNESLEFSNVVSGRANIFALFFKVGLEALKPGGTLAYVVPPSMNNGAYFKSLRKYLTTENHVKSIKIFSKSDLFVDAQTSVQVIVVQKGPGTNSHVVNFDIRGESEPLFFENPDQIEQAFLGKKTLNELGYEAVTGNIVWNQHKESLTNDKSSGKTALYYARNLSGGEIRLMPDEKKPQYLNFVPNNSFTGPAILVNRIIGSVGKGNINVGLVASGEIFSAENHLNVIRVIEGRSPEITIETLQARILGGEVLDIARLVTGNTQLSATEWNFLIPFE